MWRLGKVLGDLGGVLGASWARLGASWGGLGRLRCVLEALWRVLKNIKKTSGFIVFLGTQAQKKTSKSRLEDGLWSPRGLLGDILGLFGVSWGDAQP